MSIASVLDAIRQIRADGAELFMEGDAVLVRGTPQQRERASCALRDYDFEEVAEALATMDVPAAPFGRQLPESTARAAPKGGRPPKYRTAGERSEARRHQNRIRQQNFRQRHSVTHNAKTTLGTQRVTEWEGELTAKGHTLGLDYSSFQLQPKDARQPHRRCDSSGG